MRRRSSHQLAHIQTKTMSKNQMIEPNTLAATISVAATQQTATTTPMRALSDMGEPGYFFHRAKAINESTHGRNKTAGSVTNSLTLSR